MSSPVSIRSYVVLVKLWHRLVKLARRALGIKKTTYVRERVAEYREMWRDAALAEGFEFLPLSSSIWEVRDGERRIARMNNYIVSLDDPVTLDMAGDKLLTYELFDAAGLTIPAHSSATMDSLSRIREFVERVPGPYVVKPARNTSSGLGVTIGLQTFSQCINAAALAFTYCDEILIEEHVVGESYRLLFLGQRMISASRRSGLRVEGDGTRSLAQLLADKLGSPESDADVRMTLAAQGLGLDSVPEAGADVLVRAAGERDEGQREVRTVYTEDVTDILCAQIVDEGRKASMALGSEFCGIDVITIDPSVPLPMSGGRITEVNTTPGLHHHYHVDSTQERSPMARTVLSYIAGRTR